MALCGVCDARRCPWVCEWSPACSGVNLDRSRIAACAYAAQLDTGSLVGLVVASAIAGGLQWTGIVPLSLPLSIGSAVALGLVLALPFAADRLCYDRLPLLAGVVVFPLAQVSLELATSSLLPYAGFGA